MALTELFFPAKFGEREGSGTVTFAKGGINGSRIYQMNWDQRITFLQSLLGSQINSPGGGVATGFPEPFSTEYPWLHCREAIVRGECQIGLDGSGKIRYRVAVIEAKYMPLDFSDSIHLGGQMLTLPRYRYAWIGKDARNNVTGSSWIVKYPKKANNGTYTINGVSLRPGMMIAEIEELLEGAFGVGQVVVRDFPDSPEANDPNNPQVVYSIMVRAPGIDLDVESDLTSDPGSLSVGPVTEEAEEGEEGDGEAVSSNKYRISIEGNPAGVTGFFRVLISGKGASGGGVTGPVEFTKDEDFNFSNISTTLSAELQAAVDDAIFELNDALGEDEGTFFIGDILAAAAAEEADNIKTYQVEFQVTNEELVISTFSLSAEFVQNVIYDVQIERDGNPTPTRLDEPIGKFLPGGEYSLQKTNIATDPLLGLLFLLGCTNVTNFLGFPSMTLLFTGVDAIRIYLPTGMRAWDITFKFLYNPYTHQALYRADRSRWEFVKAHGFRQPSADSGVLIGATGEQTGLSGAQSIATDYGLIYPLGDFAVINQYY